MTGTAAGPQGVVSGLPVDDKLRELLGVVFRLRIGVEVVEITAGACSTLTTLLGLKSSVTGPPNV